MGRRVWSTRRVGQQSSAGRSGVAQGEPAPRSPIPVRHNTHTTTYPGHQIPIGSTPGRPGTHRQATPPGPARADHATPHRQDRRPGMPGWGGRDGKAIRTTTRSPRARPSLTARNRAPTSPESLIRRAFPTWPSFLGSKWAPLPTWPMGTGSGHRPQGQPAPGAPGARRGTRPPIPCRASRGRTAPNLARFPAGPYTQPNAPNYPK